MTFNCKERAIVRMLLRNRRVLDADHRYMDRFSVGITGKQLLSKLHFLRAIEQTGWYLSGRECYRLRRIKFLRELIKDTP